MKRHLVTLAAALAVLVVSAGSASASVRPAPAHGTIVYAGKGAAAAATSVHCPGGFLCIIASGNYYIPAPYEWVGGNDFYCSGTGKACLVMQGDGNLVLYDLTSSTPKALWSTHTNGHSGAYALLQGSDGNFVVYSAGGGALWHVYGEVNDYLAIQTDGNLVLYRSNGSAIWQTHTYH